jgi:hypothetical protein
MNLHIHQLKTWPGPFQDVIDGLKSFELRKGDRPYAVNDLLLLQEWDPDTEEFTGRAALRKVGYLLAGGQFGLAPDHVCMALTDPEL